MEILNMLYEGKAKKVFKTDDPQVYLVQYKDDATAFNGAKKGSIAHKGVMNNKISSLLFSALQKEGIANHFIQRLSDTEMLVKVVTIIPLEVVVRNVAAGSLAKRLGLQEGTALQSPVIELCYKNDELGDPMVNHYHIRAAGLATDEEVAQIEAEALKINTLLIHIFAQCQLDLIDFKLEFGRGLDGQILLADEISPDTCRLWDKATQEKMDKDRFRRDLGKVEEAYQEVLTRLEKVFAE